VLGCGLEVRGPPQLLRQLAADPAGLPEIMRELARLLFVLAPADLQLDVLRLPPSARALVRRDELWIGMRRDEAIADAGRELGRLRLRRRDVDWRWYFGARVETRVFEQVVAAAERLLTAP